MHSHRLSSSSFSVSPPPSPQPSTATINKNNRSDQIVQSFYGKTVQIILQSRINALISRDKSINIQGTQRSIKKQNRWFNLETEEIEEYRSETRYWRNSSISEDPTPPLFLEIYIDTSELTPNQIIVLVDEEKNKHKIDINKGDSALYFKGLSPNNSKKTILLESWKIELDKTFKDCKLELPTIYKFGIAFFRSLCLYTRLLPCFELSQRLKSSKSSGIKLGYRLTVSSNTSAHEIGFDPGHYYETSDLKVASYNFKPLVTPLGNLTLSVTSRVNCNFYKEDGEKLLSSKFQDLDAKVSLLNTRYISFNSQKNFSHRRFSSHGDIANKKPLIYTPDNNLNPHIVKSPDDMGNRSSSSSESIDSNKINQSTSSDIIPNSPKPKLNSSRDSLQKHDSILKNYDSKSLSRGSEKNMPIFASMRSSPPSHVASAIRRPPSITNFSPFKSPSLSSSPSLHNVSPPSRNSSYGNRSATSLERGLHVNATKATPISVRPNSPVPSKLSSSFGHRFGSISENPINQEHGASPSSLSRRTLSIRNSGLFERPTPTSSDAIAMNSSVDSNKYMIGLSNFIKQLTESPRLEPRTGNENISNMKSSKEILDELKNVSLKLGKLSGEMKDHIALVPSENETTNNSIVNLPLLQTGFKAESIDKGNSSQPLKIPKSSKIALSKDQTNAYNSHSIPAGPYSDHSISDPTSFSFPESKMQRSSLLSQKLNNQHSGDQPTSNKIAEPSLNRD